MFKRISSKRDPDATLWSELDREFKPYITKTKLATDSIIKRYPKVIFAIMVSLIIASSIASFFLKAAVKNPLGEVESFEQFIPKEITKTDSILQNVDLLKQGLMLQMTLDSLSNLERLTEKDKMLYGQTRNRLEKIDNLLNQQK